MSHHLQAEHISPEIHDCIHKLFRMPRHSCEGMADADDQMRRCAEYCRRCAQSCRAMSS